MIVELLPMVAGEHDHRVIEQPTVAEHGQQASQLMIGEANLTVVKRHRPGQTIGGDLLRLVVQAFDVATQILERALRLGGRRGAEHFIERRRRLIVDVRIE